MGSRSSRGNGRTAEQADDVQRPKRPIRRFDVFAEYNRLKGLAKGMDEPHAKGYGLWVAKVVASGGGRRLSSQRLGAPGASTGIKEEGERQGTPHEASHEASHEAPDGQEWHELGGEPQSDALFDREIVQRMGPNFYARVFVPAIARAVNEGKSYESIRDTLRKDWTPAGAI